MTAKPIIALPGRQATRDPALPGLAQALDAAAIGELAAKQGLVTPGAELAIRYVRYQPGRSAHITYEMTVAGSTSTACPRSR